MPTDSPELSAQLRRAAERPALRGTGPSERLILAAKEGLITRHNTREGSRGRQAVDRITYLKRKKARPSLSPSEASGHERPEVRARRAISVLLDRPDPFVILEAPTRREASRAGRYADLVGKLGAHRISPNTFERMVSAWQPIRDERFLSDPNRVLAVMEARRAGEAEPFVYEPGRP